MESYLAATQRKQTNRIKNTCLIGQKHHTTVSEWMACWWPLWSSSICFHCCCALCQVHLWCHLVSLCARYLVSLCTSHFLAPSRRYQQLVMCLLKLTCDIRWTNWLYGKMTAGEIEPSSSQSTVQCDHRSSHNVPLKRIWKYFYNIVCEIPCSVYSVLFSLLFTNILCYDKGYLAWRHAISLFVSKLNLWRLIMCRIWNSNLYAPCMLLLDIRPVLYITATCSVLANLHKMQHNASVFLYCITENETDIV